MITKKKTRGNESGVSEAEKPRGTSTKLPETGGKSVSFASEPPKTGQNDDGSGRKTIAFFFDANGKIQWDRMRESTREELRSYISSAEAKKYLGFETPDSVKTAEEVGFGDDEANALLDLLGPVDAVAASKIYGVPMEVTSVAFNFTPDHRKKINPRLTRLLNKWGPSLIKTWKDEIGCAIVVFAVVNSQVRIMHILEEKRKRGQVSSKVTPISTPEPPTPEPPAPEPPTPVPSKELEVDILAKSPDVLENIGLQVS